MQTTLAIPFMQGSNWLLTGLAQAGWRDLCDGASRWRLLRAITLPMLAPILLIVSILTIAGYFQLFAEPYVMTQGGPLQSTVSVLYFMYEQGFKLNAMGVASAIAVVIVVLALAASVLRLRAHDHVR